MALASQTARSTTTSRVYTSRRSSRRVNRTRRLIGLGALGVLFISVGMWWLSREPSPAGADPAPGAIVDPLTADTAPRVTNRPQTNAAASPGFNISNNLASNNAPAPATTPPPVAAGADVLTMGVPVTSRPEQTPASGVPSRAQDETRSPQPQSRPLPGATGAVASLIEDAANALAANEPLVARLLLNRALHDTRVTESDRRVIRERLAGINEELLFSPRIVDGDPLVSRYTIAAGDSLARIAARENLNVDWRLLQRVNRISDPRRIRVGQTIKLVRGPFYARISKADYRLDLYAGDPENSADPGMFIRSFSVGLGQYGSTPSGSWIVRKNSKLINPPWTNPQTGKHYSADNPENPIGEHWIGLEGTDDSTAALAGYGLHGTIDPNSIGSQASMGCVRLDAGDIELLYELLVEGVSRVTIE